MCSTATAAARPWTSSPSGSAGTSSPQWWPRERETHGEPWSAAAAAAEEDAVSAAIRAAYLATDHELLAQHQVRTAYCQSDTSYHQ